MKRFLYLFIILFSLLHMVCSSTDVYYNIPARNLKRVYTGLENFIQNAAEKYRDKRAVLVTNHSGVNYDLKKNVTLLRKIGLQISVVFAPEHGIHGYQNEFDKRLYNIDKRLRLVIYNLHHLTARTFRHLTKRSDVVIFDIQDMGMRCYTYVSNLKTIMDALKGTDTELIVLDRPNPLGFLGVDGPYLERRYFTHFISAFPATFLYNLTIGEAAQFYNGEYVKKVKLKVIPLKGYSRDMLYNETMLPWIPPSPNLPTYESAIVYSAVVLMEGINISLGRGTPKPFEYIGAPWIDAFSFCEGLRALKLKGLRFRPVFFKPTFSKYKGRQCAGVQIFYTGGVFSPTEVSFKIIRFIKQNYRRLRWERYRRDYDIDFLAGTNKFRLAIIQGKSWEKYLETVIKKIEAYNDRREEYLIY